LRFINCVTTLERQNLPHLAGSFISYIAASIVLGFIVTYVLSHAALMWAAHFGEKAAVREVRRSSSDGLR
jgi:hypothetical protein